MNRRYLVSIGLAALLFLAAGAVAPMIGSASISYQRAFAGLSPDHEILFYARIPRVILGLLAGGALAITGLLFQAILRDSLADPYTLGISSGASAGAAAGITFGWNTWFSATIGAFFVLFAVLGLSVEKRRLSSFTLLLAGVTMNFVAVAVIVLLHSLASVGQSFTIGRWLMGGLDATGYRSILPLACVVVPLTVLVFLRSRDWNLLAIGEEWAASRGVSANRLVFAAYLAGSFLTAAVTSFSGPVGFVGLIVPHALRIRLGADHRLLVPCSFFVGGAFLTICDTAARTVLSPSELPVGVITALVGGPVFVWMLRRQRPTGA